MYFAYAKSPVKPTLTLILYLMKIIWWKVLPSTSAHLKTSFTSQVGLENYVLRAKKRMEDNRKRINQLHRLPQAKIKMN